MPASSLASATPIERWSLVNAAGVLAATAGAWALGSVWVIVVVGGGLLGGLVVVARRRWTPQGHFGRANGVTALRVGLLGLLPLVEPPVLIALSLLILATDGLDGWLARRGDLESEFGAFFDKETDALFLLLLCGIAAVDDRLPVWILGAGLLRYAFVPLLFLLPAPKNTEERSSGARYVYGAMVLALLTAFLPVPALYEPLVALASGALVLSFARSLWRIVPRPQPFGER